MKPMPIASTAFAIAALLAVSPASASIYAFSYSGLGGTSASGTITTSGSIAATITGTHDGMPIAELLPPNTYGLNDNFVSATAPFLHPAGLAFESGGIDYNIYYYAGYFECASSSTSCILVGAGTPLTSFSLTSASADLYDFSYSGLGGISASGTITASGSIATAITGTHDGMSIAELLPPNAYGLNDNFISGTAPYLDPAGLAFESGGLDYNIYYYAGYYECASSATSCILVGAGVPLISLSVVPTSSIPEPFSWAVYATGLAGVLLSRRRPIL